MALSRVEWRGKEIELMVVEKLVAAIDETTKAAADDAKSQHWWLNRSGDLEANVIMKPAVVEGPLVIGKFGSSMRAEGFYGLFLERKRPWLRPAADRHFHELPLKLKGMLRWT